MKQRIPVRMMLHMVTIVAVEVSHVERIAMDKMWLSFRSLVSFWIGSRSGLLQLR